MCVIVHKERGIDVPSEEVFQKCFNKNPDGSGILIHRKDTNLCEIHKGYMNFEDFKKALKGLNITKDDDAAFHFRITTSGGTSPENCHPFPISNKVDDLKATRINTPLAFVHNGVLGSGDDTDKISDTQVFIRDVLSRPEIKDNLTNSEVQKIISELAGTGNRFLLFDAKNDLFKRIGSGWIKDDGSQCWFSNSHWKVERKTYNNYYNSDYYDSGYYDSQTGKWVTNSSAKKKPLPDIYTVLCPNCDETMNRMLEMEDFYCCPKCGTLYNNNSFSIYKKETNEWISIFDLNGFGNQTSSENKKSETTTNPPSNTTSIVPFDPK